MDKVLNHYLEGLITWMPKLAMAILTLLIGLWLINRATKLIGHVLLRRDVDPTVVPFLRSLVDVIFKVILLISVAGMFGIQTTSFVAIIGAAGLAVGLALQGSLGHFASGVMLLVFKPYKYGDEVTIGGNHGIVDEVQVFNTVLSTPEGRKIIIPNGLVTSGPIINHSAKGKLRVMIPMLLAPDTDLSDTTQWIKEVLDADSGILKDHEVEIAIIDAEESFLKIEVRFWCVQQDFVPIKGRNTENIVQALRKNGVKFGKKEV